MSARSRELWRPLVWRVAAFAIVYLLAVVAMSSGVGITQRDLSDAGILQRAYYALGLFVLGGLDLGTPVGGPEAARALLWMTYFVAPLITVSALVEAALRLLWPLALRARRLSGHVILGGAGRLTLIYVRKLRERDPKRPIVVVDQDANHPLMAELRDVHHAIVVIGDVARSETLRELRLETAHRVVLLTGDDFANLDAAAKVLRLAPGMAGRIVVHVSDLRVVRETKGSSIARACEIFNGHEFAAINLVQEHLMKRFESTPYRDLIVLAGFGRFGQTVLHQLQKHALGSFGRVVIIDENASSHVLAFEEEPGFSEDYDRLMIEGNLKDPAIWVRIGRIVEAHGESPIVILGSGDDGTNLHAALRVRRQHPDAYVITRSFRSSPFTEEVAREAGAQAFNLAALIGNGMPERWF
jgi:Trk K+ transport system NAD-binding subunit